MAYAELSQCEDQEEGTMESAPLSTNLDSSYQHETAKENTDAGEEERKIPSEPAADTQKGITIFSSLAKS